MPIGRSKARLLTGLAIVMAVTTAVSVGLAIFALIHDARLAALYALAAVALDVFKYLAWPTALQIGANGRRASAALMMAAGLALSGVSGWATYDRMMSSMLGAQAQQAAIAGQRIVDLQQAQSDARARIAQLDATASRIASEASALRARGMVSKALELETATSTRLDTQRTEQAALLDAASRELTRLRAVPAPTLPERLAALICLGFALALELVPALIFSALRPDQPRSGTTAGITQGAPEPAETAQESATSPSDSPLGAAAGIPPPRFAPGSLMATLLEQVASSPPGAPIAVRPFARQQGISNGRAVALFQQAAELGAISKTIKGYVARAAGDGHGQLLKTGKEEP